tara:strand:+ start:80 stop:853 length:774 start_codon:yes stop_codon:yes gene_type:complete
MTNELFEIDLYGFTLIKNVLEKNTVNNLKVLNHKYLNTHGENQKKVSFRNYDTLDRKNNTTKLIPNLPSIDPEYFFLIDHPRILPILEKIMGNEIILGSLTSRIVRPNDTAQKLHSDIPSRLHRNSFPVMMNTMWILDDFKVDNGATIIIPGSHKMDIDKLNPNAPLPHLTYRVIAPSGSVLIFNGQCWHGSGANRTDQDRHAIFGHYRINDWMLFQLDPTKNFPKKWVKLLNKRQKELMRMTNGINSPISDDTSIN